MNLQIDKRDINRQRFRLGRPIALPVMALLLMVGPAMAQPDPVDEEASEDLADQPMEEVADEPEEPMERPAPDETPGEPAEPAPEAPAPEASDSEAAAASPDAKGRSDEDLAQQLTNPIASLVSIPFQFNWRNGVGPNDDLQLVLNIQPVVPVQLNADWRLIGRFIMPVISQPALAPGDTPRTGLGDAIVSLFGSPVSNSKFQWGAGPVFGLPLTTDPSLGTGQWNIGPTAVGIYMTGGWTFVLLGNHLFSIAETGDIERADVNQSFIQPVVAYTTSSAFTFSLQSETSINWEAEDGEEATVPINIGISKLTKFGPLPFSVQIGGGVFAEAPTGGPDWQLRLSMAILLPVASK